MSTVKSKKGVGEWHYLGDLTTLDNLHSTVPFGISAYHKPEFKKEEEEIFEHYAQWMLFNDTRFATHPEEGTGFYDLDQVLYYDLMGLIPRGGFRNHFYHIEPYYSSSHIGYKDMEIIAVAPDFGFCNMFQHYYGVSTDGNEFDFKFRYTGLLRKRDGVWKWIEEHVSFPANIATGKADFTNNQDAGEHLMMRDEDNRKRVDSEYCSSSRREVIVKAEAI